MPHVAEGKLPPQEFPRRNLWAAAAVAVPTALALAGHSASARRRKFRVQLCSGPDSEAAVMELNKSTDSDDEPQEEPQQNGLAEGGSSSSKQRRRPKGSLVIGQRQDSLRLWGGDGYKVSSVGFGAQRLDALKLKQEKQIVRAKWLPKREHWDGWITDDIEESFGGVLPGQEVQVFVERSTQERSWADGVVLGADMEAGRLAVRLALDNLPVVEVSLGSGSVRRPEDARELCTDEELNLVSRCRSREDVAGLCEFILKTPSIAARSHGIAALARMGKPGTAQRLLERECLNITSVALREIAHCHANAGDLTSALSVVFGLQGSQLPRHAAALLHVEVMALAVTGVIQVEKAKSGINQTMFLLGVEQNVAVQEIVRTAAESFPKLEACAQEVRDLPALTSRDGFTEAFNELLLSCGRACAVSLSFKVLEWMEVMVIPKNAFTYEAIGLNIVKRVTPLSKVWDLPTAPEELCPEVVFAGRSNVGKSSLVNMMLGRIALAPTSNKPGKTKTMDFYDVNAGHPALPRFRLVDVPGLGFAKASADMRTRWVNMIGGYFVQRRALRIVFHLLDAQLGEILDPDRQLWRLLAEAKRTDYELCICLTKSDNATAPMLEKFAKVIRDELRRQGSAIAVNATIFACSSKTKLGKDTLWRKIWTALQDRPEDDEVLDLEDDEEGEETEATGPESLDFDAIGPADALRWRQEEFAYQPGEEEEMEADRNEKRAEASRQYERRKEERRQRQKAAKQAAAKRRQEEEWAAQHGKRPPPGILNIFLSDEGGLLVPRQDTDED